MLQEGNLGLHLDRDTDQARNPKLARPNLSGLAAKADPTTGALKISVETREAHLEAYAEEQGGHEAGWGHCLDDFREHWPTQEGTVALAYGYRSRRAPNATPERIVDDTVHLGLTRSKAPTTLISANC